MLRSKVALVSQLSLPREEAQQAGMLTCILIWGWEREDAWLGPPLPCPLYPQRVRGGVTAGLSGLSPSLLGSSDPGRDLRGGKGHDWGLCPLNGQQSVDTHSGNPLSTL